MIETRTLSGLHVITDNVAPTESPNPRTLLEALPLVVAENPTLIQVRLSHATDAELLRLGEQVMDLAEGVPVIINDNANVAKQLGAAGVHVGPRDISPEEARDIIGPEGIVGVSVYNVAQAEKVMGSDAAINYVGFGPIGTTRSGPQGHRPQGLEGLRVMRDALPGMTMVVLGGIRRRPQLNGTRVYGAQEVLDAGADGWGVVGDIFRAPHPGVATREYVQMAPRGR